MNDYDITNYSERPAPKVAAEKTGKRVRKTRTPEQRARRNERDKALRAKKAAAKAGGFESSLDRF